MKKVDDSNDNNFTDVFVSYVQVCFSDPVTRWSQVMPCVKI